MTGKQRELLDFMCQFLADHQRYPSCREAAEGLGVTSNAIAERMGRLERDGHLVRPGSGNTGYQIVGLMFHVEHNGRTWTTPQLAGSVTPVPP